MANQNSKLFIIGISKQSPEAELAAAIKQTLLSATDSLAWLKAGQTVLLKPALNSPDPYPATTHPLAVKIVREEIEMRGGKVIVGDQSGIGHVMQDKTGVVYGDSAKCYAQSGMNAAGGKFVAFEKEDWNNGFVKFSSNKTPSWPDGFYITKWIERVDHIVNLPRLSTHAQAGVTLGFKSLVGMLRQDSRQLFHANGPFYSFFKNLAKGSQLAEANDGQKLFFEKMTEIYASVASRMRLTLFVGTSAQVTNGPDRYSVQRDGLKMLRAHVVAPEVGLIIAGTDPVAAEAGAIAFLKILYDDIAGWRKLGQAMLMGINGQAKTLGQESEWSNPFIKTALARGFGQRNFSPSFHDVPAGLIEKLTERLK